jgi:hypothetical protein
MLKQEMSRRENSKISKKWHFKKAKDQRKRDQKENQTNLIQQDVVLFEFDDEFEKMMYLFR